MNFMIIFTLWWELVRFKNKKQKNLTTYKTFFRSKFYIFPRKKQNKTKRKTRINNEPPRTNRCQLDKECEIIW